MTCEFLVGLSDSVRTREREGLLGDETDFGTVTIRHDRGSRTGRDFFFLFMFLVEAFVTVRWKYKCRVGRVAPISNT